MLLLILIGVVVLYICLRTEWVLLLLFAVLFTLPQKNVEAHASSCADVSVALQKEFPLCWMMSTVGLLNNIINVHKIDFLHADVINLINDWKNLDHLNPKDTECPLIRPRKLRKRLEIMQSGLNQVMVKVYKSEEDAKSKQGECLAQRTQGWLGYVSSLFRREQGSVEAVPTRDSRLTIHKTAGPALEETKSFIANYDDQIVTDYLDGKRWWNQHRVCVRKFTGKMQQDTIELLFHMITYGTRLIDVWTTPSSKISLFESEKYLVANIVDVADEKQDVRFPFIDRLDEIIDEQPILPFKPIIVQYNILREDLLFVRKLREDSMMDLDYNYKVLGGTLSFRTKNARHVVHFVTCEETMFFLDSNIDEKIKPNELKHLLRGYEYQKTDSVASVIFLRDPPPRRSKRRRT